VSQASSDTVKRLFDIGVSGFLLALTSPVLVTAAVSIKMGSPGAVFYRGRRVGRNNRVFWMLKFRTMTADAEARGGTSTPADDPRITRVGRFLRRFKVDELPQFINVFLGDMSIVGPRPQVEWAVALYDQDARRLLDVRPGITDYASIRFSNEGDILAGSADPDREYLVRIAPEKIRLGLAYVERHSLWIDLKIIAATAMHLAGFDVAWVFPPAARHAMSQHSAPARR